jgi:hypothetical protein
MVLYKYMTNMKYIMKKVVVETGNHHQERGKQRGLSQRSGKPIVFCQVYAPSSLLVVVCIDLIHIHVPTLFLL